MDKLVSQAADIGAAIASTRKRSKIRQQDLADLAGVSCRFLSDLENGKNPWSSVRRFGSFRHSVSTSSFDSAERAASTREAQGSRYLFRRQSREWDRR